MTVCVMSLLLYVLGGFPGVMALFSIDNYCCNSLACAVYLSI